MSSEKPNIVIVDDNPDNLRTLSNILQQEGYKIRPVSTGMMALHTIRIKHPDLILLDIRMPRMNGYQVCEALKTAPETSNIPIIFISALDEVGDKVKAFDVGGADYITKPFQIREVLVRIKHQLTIRQQQQELTGLYTQVQDLNINLERQVQVRTLELRQALEFESLLRQITEKVRDFLDQSLILQAAVEGLTKALEAQGCQAILTQSRLDQEQIHYQFIKEGIPLAQEHVLALLNTPAIYAQLEQGQVVILCPYVTDANTQRISIVVCPICDEQQTLGLFWIYKSALSSFGQQEIHLMEQVANQCAIALRQAQLYDMAQQQIRELQRLNQLKDDFLSTISHELRTPVASMRMVLQLLMAATEQGTTFVRQLHQEDTLGHKVASYFKILQVECEREIHLIQNLLDLQHLQAGTRPLELTTIELDAWLRHVLETFVEQIQTQKQQLEIEIASDLPPFTTDLEGLRSILTELLGNACKYTPVGETIAISMTVMGDHLCLTVTNPGANIPADEQPHVFEPFYRVHDGDRWKHGGTGLGLALVKAWVNALQGTVDLISQEQTIQVTVKLPLQLSAP